MKTLRWKKWFVVVTIMWGGIVFSINDGDLTHGTIYDLIGIGMMIVGFFTAALIRHGQLVGLIKPLN